MGRKSILRRNYYEVVSYPSGRVKSRHYSLKAAKKAASEGDIVRSIIVRS